MILNSQQIIDLHEQDSQFICPFDATSCLGTTGYDVRIAQDVVLYPKTLPYLLLNAMGIPRKSFVLASTIESFKIPTNTKVRVADKSTWARKGILVGNTVIHPGWESQSLTLELFNCGEQVVHIPRRTLIAHLEFVLMPHSKPYDGKYNNQGFDPVPAR